MNEHIPQVSVLELTYNRRLFIQEVIASVLAQALRNSEIIVSDDCSLDDTEQVMLVIKDPRTIYVKNNVNIETINNCDKALWLARGKYVHVFSDNKTVVPENLALRAAIMEQYLNVGLIHSNINVIDGDSIVTDTNQWATRHASIAAMW